MANELRKVTDVNGVNHPVTDDNRVPWSANAVLGAKNFFDASKAEFKNGGLTCTKNADGSISIGAGTTTEELNYPNNASYANCYELEPSTEYIFSIGSAVTNLRLRVFCKTTSSSDWTIIANEQGVENIHFTTPASFYAIWVRIDCDSNKAISAATLYPMIRLASDTDPTYAPYAMTNQQLTEKVTVQESACTDILEGATASVNKLYKQGNVVSLDLSLNSVTASSYSEVLAKVPAGYRPKNNAFVMAWTSNASDSNHAMLQINANGNIMTALFNVSNASVIFHATWITS